MDENTLKTTIILRNDVTASWADSTLVLEKGEVGIDTEKASLKSVTGNILFHK